jgi:hypothetical protein
MKASRKQQNEITETGSGTKFDYFLDLLIKKQKQIKNGKRRKTCFRT